MDLLPSTLSGPASLWLLAIIAVVIQIYRKVPSYINRPRAPPGPKPRPIVGHVFDIPSVKPWLTYQQWSYTYGDVVSIRLLHQPLVILGSAQAAFDILDKRSSICSDRLKVIMLDFFAFMRYGARWRKHRRLFHQYFHPGVVHEYDSSVTRETRALLRRLLGSFGSIDQHVRLTVAASILNVVYGMDVTSINDEYLRLVEVAMKGGSVGATPGAFFVELIPLLQYVPEWFPGAKFRKTAAYYKYHVRAMRDQPFDTVKSALTDGTAVNSVAASIIKNLKQDGDKTKTQGGNEDEEIARNTAANAYAGAADTTASATLCFLLAMVLYPDVQRKAQAELDAHVGLGRLPEFSDYDNLTYIRAIVLETVRWMPVLPLGVPHRVTEDFEYNGYTIRKGTAILTNVWAILHNSQEYPDPEAFRPERFIKDGKLDPDVKSPLNFAFGFGRRICPGRHFATNSLFLIVASLLHVFDILPPQDHRGNIIKLEANMSSDLISFPEHVDCRFVSRSEVSERLIRESAP